MYPISIDVLLFKICTPLENFCIRPWLKFCFTSVNRLNFIVFSIHWLRYGQHLNYSDVVHTGDTIIAIYMKKKIHQNSVRMTTSYNSVEKFANNNSFLFRFDTKIIYVTTRYTRS